MPRQPVQEPQAFPIKPAKGPLLQAISDHSPQEVLAQICWRGSSEDHVSDSVRGARTSPQAVFLLAPLITDNDRDFVFKGTVEGKPLVGFPRLWKKLFKGTALAGITPHVLRHSFSSIANDLGFTEATIGALMGHSRGTVTGRYIHTVDSLLVMAADTVAGYVQGLLDGKKFRPTTYALDRASREAALVRLLEQATLAEANETEQRIAA